MRIFTLWQNRTLLFRSYLIIVGGLIVVAGVLDFGFDRLQNAKTPVVDPWIDRNLTLIETYLSRESPVEWPAATIALEAALGLPVKVFPRDHVVSTGTLGEATQEILNEAGDSAFVRSSEKLDSVIQIGPVPMAQSPDSPLFLLMPMLFYLAIFVFVGLWLWPLVRDLNVLTEAARAFARDYRKPIQTLEKITSLRDLARNFDQMSERIRKLIQGQKELTGALSHEMRTPLTRIKFAMAVMSDKADESPDLQSISQDVQEIEGLITTMLDYARLDQADMEINLQLTPMDAWLSQVVNKFRAPHEALAIECHAGPEQIQMDPYLMELAVSNLLVNACRYARTAVVVRFARAGSNCRLSVEDDGEGIPEPERESVFKAFTRLDSSRNRETGGYGLGLAIVARIAALHGGSARAEQSGLGGARIQIAWRSGQNGPAEALQDSLTP